MKKTMRKWVSTLTAGILVFQMLSVAAFSEDQVPLAQDHADSSSLQSESTNAEENQSPPVGESASSQPLKNEAIPPVSEEKPSEEGETPPTDEQIPPVDGETPPTDEQIPPVDGETPPTGEEIPPVDGETPPTGEEAPPAEGETPPAGEDVPPVDGETPPSGEEVPPADGEKPPVGEEVPPVDGEIPPADGEKPPVGEEIPPAEEKPAAIVLASFAALSTEQVRVLVEAGTPFEEIELPESLLAVDTSGNEQTITGVTWTCSAYVAEETKAGNEYHATAVLPQGYELAESVELPIIVIFITGSSSRVINDRISFEGGIYKEINPTEAQLIGYDTSLGIIDLVIPETIVNQVTGNTLKVISVEAEAFKNCAALNSVKFEGNPAIKASAFAGSKVSSIDFGEKLAALGDHMFSNCAVLKSVTIPSNIKDMSYNAFSSSGLETVIFENEGPASSGNYTFDYCSKLNNVTLAEGMTSINYSFSHCPSLKEITVPGTVQSFYEAFKNSGIEKVVLKDGIKNISSRAFYECSTLKSITIPDSVTQIDYDAFYRCAALKSIQLPSNLVKIGAQAFNNFTGLEKIVIPDSVSIIENQAFYNCRNLVEVTLPQNLASIGQSAFRDCVSLESIAIPDQVTSLGYEAFRGCTKLKQVTLPKNITALQSSLFDTCMALEQIQIPASVRSIGSNAFASCILLEQIDLPENLTSIGPSAFYGCFSLNNITIPAGISFLPDALFYSCSELKNITIPSNITGIGYNVFKDSGITEISIPNSVKTIGGSAFQNCQDITKVTISADNMTIGASAFTGCPKLTTVTIDGTVSSIGLNAFAANATVKVSVPDEKTAVMVRDSGGILPENIFILGNPSNLDPSEFVDSGITYQVTSTVEGSREVMVKATDGVTGSELKIPAKVKNAKGTEYTVTMIGNGAVRNKYQIVTVELPNTLTKIEMNAFAGSSGLKKIVIPETVTSIGSNAFQNCIALEEIRLPDQISNLDSAMFSGCKNLKTVHLPEKAQSIGNSFFYECIALTAIDLPDGLERIGEHAFYKTGLTSITIPYGLSQIGPYSFFECKKLKSVTFPDSLTEIYHSAFQNCTALESVKLPKSLRILGGDAFGNCMALKSVEINSDLGTFYNYNGMGHFAIRVFANCKALEHVTFSENVTESPQRMFENCTALTSISLPDGMQAVDAAYFSGCTGLVSVKLPKNLKWIYNNAFRNCTALKDITFPASLYNVNSEAFMGCEALENVTLGNSVSEIGAGAFVGCTNLQWAKIGWNLQKIGAQAFPTSTQLIANDSRVQLLLVEYLNQNTDKRPGSEWSGNSDVQPGAIAVVNEDTQVKITVTIAKDAEVSVLKSVLVVSGTLKVEGKLTIDENSHLVLMPGGQITGSNAAGLPIEYTVTTPETEYGVITANRPHAKAGEVITLTVTPLPGCRLKPDTLSYNGINLKADENGVYSFKMPAACVAISGEFESTLRIKGPADTTIKNGQTLQFTAEFPEDIDATGAVYRWSADDRVNAITLSGADTAAVTVTGNVVSDDIDTTLTLTVTLQDQQFTATETIHVLADKLLRINEKPAAAFRPGNTYQLTATLNEESTPTKEVNWASRLPSVAEIDANGLVTVRGIGTTMITASTKTTPPITASLELSAVLDVGGTLRYLDGGVGAFKTVDVTKDGSAFKTVYTDANGSFTLNALEAGAYTLVSEPTLPGYDQASGTFTLQEGDNAANWVLEYPKCDTGSVAYRFLDTAGKPVSGVRVYLQCDSPYQAMVSNSSDSGEGNFEQLSYAPSGTSFRLSYSTNDGGFGSDTVVLKRGEGAKTVSYTLPQISTVTGRVTDGKGTGISGLCVLVGNRSAYTNDSGTYSVRGQLEPGIYTVKIADWEKYFPIEDAPSITVTEGNTVEVPEIPVTMGISIAGRVFLDGRTDNYKKAYVALYDEKGGLMAGGYAVGAGGYALDGVIKRTGSYRVTVNQIYDPVGWYSVNYDADAVSFTVSDLSQERVSVDLKAKSKLKTSEIFRGQGNSLTASTQLAQAGGKLELTAKFKNNGTETVSAQFETILTNTAVDPGYSGGEFGQLRHSVNLAPGATGSFLIKTLTDNKGATVAAAETRVTIGGETYDFGKVSVDIANVTLNSDVASIKAGHAFRVYGEAVKNSSIRIYGPGNQLLGLTAIGEDEGRWYSIEMSGFEKEGIYPIYALADMGSELAVSDPIQIEVTANPITLQKVSVDQLGYDDLPVNARVGVRSFSHMLDASLVPEPLSVRSLFTAGERIRAVTYHFAENDYPAQKDGQGRWYADLSNWRGTGIKQLTATVQTEKQSMRFVIAEVTVLVDPSGHILDADTEAPLAGVQVTCYQKDNDSSYFRWDSDRYGQPANPWKTGSNGKYGWHVPDGVYRIDVEKAGYESATSEELPKYTGGIQIPPPALDVDFSLVPTTEMTLESLSSRDGKILAQFSRHVKSAQVTVYDGEGKETPVTSSISGNTVVLTGSGLTNGKTYTVELRDISPKSGSKESYALKSAKGTVAFVRSQSGHSGGGSSSGGSGGSSTSGLRKGVVGGMTSTLKLAPTEVRKAPRENNCAVIKMTGPDPKTTGTALANALKALKTGEKLMVRGTQDKIPYQFVIDPSKVSGLPATIAFGLSPKHEKTVTLFSKYFTNKLTAIACKQSGPYGFSGELQIKLNLSGMNPQTLNAYTYNPVANQYTQLAISPTVDAAGYVHLQLEAGGIIVLSDGPLTKR